jgi:GNAT superfamily N-acetyltransferase
MISSGKDKYISALQALWKLCFPKDADTFIRFYFDEVYKNDETLVYLENGEPVAALQIIPYSVKNGEEIFPAGYISGAMTHPDFRRKRYMRELLLLSFDRMREQGFDYTFLIPQEKWLFDFYGKFGYKPLEFTPLQAKHGEYPPSVEHPCSVYTGLPDPVCIDQIVYPTYFRFLSEVPQIVLKNEEQFRQILLDFFDGNGVLFANEQGIAFTLKEEHCIMIKEFFYQDSNVKDWFLKNIRDYYSKEELILLNSSDHLIGKQGMIKQLNNDKPKISSLYISMMLD